MKRVFIIALVVLLALGFLFQFIFTWHRSDDKTMEATIEKGELVWINKAAVGAWFLGMKMPALSSIEPNDIVYYAYPEDFDSPMYEKQRMISRVAGCPGDRIFIRGKILHVNGEDMGFPEKSKLGYRAMFNEDVDVQELLNHYDLDQAESVIDSLGIYEVPLTEDMSDSLQKDPNVNYVRLIKQVRGGANRVFPKSPYRSWSEDDFGPLEIPKAGDIIELNYRNYDIYRNIIVQFEGHDVIKHKGEIHIDGKKSNSYTIKKNYYFLLDDNRDRYFDSREFGFVPEEYILGKVIGAE
ncbi:signal peptidase I [Salinivirga cyanobacteriivorans]|uniref:Signal peptidase I n=1 Tax=Salinivirga cyanobacteriivorans TaxID=1307839 RepID=A0A0S2I4K0_9BACT|nr:signal peptidase I [Salinivirga cyanobacteriivorans]ALO17101.1 signal peptidase I [Salinivirga cyanobacteriivorans]